MNVHWAPLAVAGGFVAIEGAANAGASVGHFAAAGATIVGIAAVLKGWAWVRREVGVQIDTAIRIHGLEDEKRHETVKAEIAKLAVEFAACPFNRKER